MSGIYALLIGGASGFGASTHLLSVGNGGLFSPFFTYSAYGFAVDAFGLIYTPGSGTLAPNTRSTYRLAEISYYATSIGGSGMICDFVWTTQNGLASKFRFDGVDYLVSDAGFAAATSSTVTISIATPAVVSWTSNGRSNGDMVMFRTTGALPTGLTPETVYYVVNAATNTFQVSATLGGAAIATSGTQSGTHTVFVRPRRRFTVASPPTSAPNWARGAVAATASAANPTTWTSTSHGFSTGQTVTFTTSGSLPSGLAVGTKYFVINATTNTFQVSATSGGAALGNGASQSGTHIVSRAIELIIT